MVINPVLCAAILTSS